MRELKDSVVVITGGARGMGREYLKGFAAEGARVAALDLSWQPTGFSGDDDESFYKWVDGQENILRLTADITSDDQIGAAIGGSWKARDDRYSELRSSFSTELQRIEMSYIGG